ncbi:hypothetical protein V6N11_047979 [Hibiscus sabdariffa]|uniref:Uncharacterized protein n=2 Tax=Hibiscus sabdariffa TaxID=183260 RepID=A0ABR2B664_9ROSI
MGRSAMSISLLVLACLVGSAAPQSSENVNAHWTNFGAEEADWDMNKANNVYCEKYDVDMPYEWRSRYYWTDIGDLVDISIDEACGKCIHVTNTGTGDETTVRIVGPTGHGLELDKPVFDQLDSDGNGRIVGHLVVNYTFVDCDPIPPGPGDSNVTAYFSDDYNPVQNNWTYPSHAACAALDGDICGKCLKVTNTEKKVSVTVRIMDTCGAGALELDHETGFDPIDVDGCGNAAGHLTVDYEFVKCEDEVDSPLLVYSQ